MLTAQQKVLRRFFYSIMPLAHLKDGPKPFTLLGEKIVLFLDAAGNPVALADRCRHRSARLSKGWVRDGNIVCGYHGWEYDNTGTLCRIPQLAEGTAFERQQVTRYNCEARYGYAWVALDDPIAPIFDVPEDADPGYRRIFQFYDTWSCAPLRLMENSFDNAHFSYVHRGTFGDMQQPKPSRYEIFETDYGFRADTVVEVVNPPNALRITGTDAPFTTRTMRNHWYIPFCRRLDMEYPSGIRHIIINSATPIDDGHIQLTQLLYRNDREEDCSTQELIDWDAAIIAEDRDILEATDPDAPLDASRQANMPSDRPGLIMRRRLAALLREAGEAEVTRV